MGAGFGCILLLIAAGLVAVGIVLLVRGLRTGKPYPSCGNPACGYDLTGTIGTADRCPECGSAFAAAGIVPPGRGRRPWMIAAGIALMLLPAVLVFAMFFATARVVQVRSAQTIPGPVQQTAPPAPTTPLPPPETERDD